MLAATHAIIQSMADAPPPPTLPGDFGPGAHVAYSLRKVISTYSGPVVRVRRSSDNTTIDLTADQITDGTLTAFVGAGDGFVNILYNQTATTSRDLNQGTTFNQPILVEAGVIYTENGKPSMKFDGSRFLSAGNLAHWTFLHSQKSSVFSVQKIAGTNPDTLYGIWATGQSISGTRMAYLRYDDRSGSGFNDNWFHVIGNSGTVVSNTTINQFTPNKLLTARVHGDPANATLLNRSFTGVDSNSLVNLNTGATSLSTSNPTHALRLGDANSGWRLVGAISEVIIYFNGTDNAQAFDSSIDSEMKTYYSIT